MDANTSKPPLLDWVDDSNDASKRFPLSRFAEDFMREGFESPGYGWSGPSMHK